MPSVDPATLLTIAALGVALVVLLITWVRLPAFLALAVASIFVDLGLKAFAPNEKRPWLLWVWVEMRSPRDDGLSSAEEAPRLFEIEESLKAMINPACGAQLVGRITGSGRREFYFYAEEPGELDEALNRALTSFADYRVQSGSKFEPEWEQYLELLYPSATNLQRMMNRRVLELLAEKGDVHETPRKVEHWLQFPEEAARDACRETLLAIEFALEGEYHDEDAGAALPWSRSAWAKATPPGRARSVRPTL